MVKKKILIVEDETSIVTLLKYNIESAGFRTDAAYDGLTGLRKAKEQHFDLILLDLMLPKLTGLEVCKQLRGNHIHTPILILTAKSDEENKISGLNLGADDYLTKPFSPKEVIARIHAILRRTQGEHSKVLQIGELYIYPEQYKALIHTKTLTFTRKEFELLLYLVRHKYKVIPRKQLLSEVWKYDFFGDTRIVDVHISRLREKIETDQKNPVYIKTIRGVGYTMEEPSSFI